MKISSFSVQSPSFIAVLALGLGLSLAACDDSDNERRRAVIKLIRSAILG